MRGSSLIHCCHSLMEKKKKKKNQNIKINIKNLKRQTSHRVALAHISYPALRRVKKSGNH